MLHQCFWARMGFHPVGARVHPSCPDSATLGHGAIRGDPWLWLQCSSVTRVLLQDPQTRLCPIGTAFGWSSCSPRKCNAFEREGADRSLAVRDVEQGRPDSQRPLQTPCPTPNTCPQHRGLQRAPQVPRDSPSICHRLQPSQLKRPDTRLKIK